MLSYVFIAFSIIYSTGGCRHGWIAFSGKCYGYGESRITWSDAQELCTDHGASLAEIETESENVFLREFIGNRSAPFVWLGATDIFQETKWAWLSSGQSFDAFSDWDYGEPDEAGTGEDCLTLLINSEDTTYHWNDLDCSLLANFVCEAVDDGTIVG